MASAYDVSAERGALLTAKDAADDHAAGHAADTQ
jgi:hypothetical protein